MQSPSSAGHAPRLYVNAVRASGSGYDVILDVGFRSHADEEPEVLAQLVMSWEHAKSLLPLLQKLIDGFEEQVAPIPKPPLKVEVES